MLRSAITNQISVDNRLVFAFCINDEIHGEDLKPMGAIMNDAFDVHQFVSMMLIFEQVEGLDAGAGFEIETVRSKFQSLVKVDKFAVVGALSIASTMINVMDTVIPTDARTFEQSDEAAAWAFVGAYPVVTSQASPVA